MSHDKAKNEHLMTCMHPLTTMSISRGIILPIPNNQTYLSPTPPTSATPRISPFLVHNPFVIVYICRFSSMSTYFLSSIPLPCLDLECVELPNCLASTLNNISTLWSLTIWTNLIFCLDIYEWLWNLMTTFQWMNKD